MVFSESPHIFIYLFYFLVGIMYFWQESMAGYHGPGKPKDVNIFLGDFQEEAITLKFSGILFEGNKIIFCYWNEMRRPNNFIYFEH